MDNGRRVFTVLFDVNLSLKALSAIGTLISSFALTSIRLMVLMLMLGGRAYVPAVIADSYLRVWFDCQRLSGCLIIWAISTFQYK